MDHYVRAIRALPALVLLALAGSVLASACGGAATPESQLVFHVDQSGNRDIYVSDTRGSDLTNLTANLPGEAFPMWSPDGKQIVFYSQGGDNRDIYVAQADGSAVINLTDSPAEDALPVWSPDGSRILFYSDRDGNGDV